WARVPTNDDCLLINGGHGRSQALAPLAHPTARFRAREGIDFQLVALQPRHARCHGGTMLRSAVVTSVAGHRLPRFALLIRWMRQLAFAIDAPPADCGRAHAAAPPP